MKEYIKLQSQFCSDIDIKKICTFDYETVTESTVSICYRNPRFIFVKEGRGKISVDNGVYELKEGVLFSILPWKCTQIIEVEEPLSYEIIKYKYDVVADILKSTSCMNDSISALKKMEETPYAYLEDNMKRDGEYLFRCIREEVGVESAQDFRERRSYQEMNIVMRIASLIITFCRAADQKKDSPSIQSPSFDNRELILRYIYMHLSQKITLENLSKKFYLNKNSIRLYIFEKTGFAFHELIQEMRITKTINYLLYTNFTLNEIAALLGYVDAAHISKVFSNKMKSKIRDYRKTYQRVLNIASIKEKKLEYQLVEYITRNFKEEIQAGSVADKFGISMEEMNRYLLMQVECNYYDFINRLRIDYACEQLLSTDMPITDIAIDAGYNTERTFRRNFMNLRHVLPNEYRLTHAELVN